MPDGFVWVCAQAVCEAIEHIHAEIGIAHNNVRMSSVLFDVGGRIRLGDPLPLLVRNALDGKAPQFLPSNGQGRDMKTQQEEQEAKRVSGPISRLGHHKGAGPPTTDKADMKTHVGYNLAPINAVRSQETNEMSKHDLHERTTKRMDGRTHTHT